MIDMEEGVKNAAVEGFLKHLYICDRNAYEEVIKKLLKEEDEETRAWYREIDKLLTDTEEVTLTEFETTIYQTKRTIGDLLDALNEDPESSEFDPGNTITIRYDGHEETMVIIGRDVDKSLDPRVKHTLTLQHEHLLDEDMVFDEDGCNKWVDSDIRARLNSNEWLRKYESILPYMQMVAKEKEEADKVFLLSKDEYDSKKTPYSYFKDKRNTCKFRKDGSAEWQWTRSVLRSTTYNAWILNTTGYANDSAAYYAYATAPVCVIGKESE